MEANASPLLSREQFEELVRKANAGDSDSLASLRRYLGEHPEIWKQVGDLSLHVQENHIRKIAAGNKLMAESLRKLADQLRKDLEGPNPSSLEKVAIDNVVAAWFERHYIDLTYPPGYGTELPMARYVVQLRNGAQKRFDTAMKSLLLVREKMPGIDEANRQTLRKKGKVLPFQKEAAS